jgi:hypothetical protein
MSDQIKENDVAGTSFRVGDAYIWAEIHYLDSPSDYREHLPQNSAVAPAARGELMMLDSARSFSVSKTFGLLLLVFAIIFLTAGYFLHAIIETL